jgi:hypothetical protein
MSAAGQTLRLHAMSALSGEAARHMEAVTAQAEAIKESNGPLVTPYIDAIMSITAAAVSHVVATALANVRSDSDPGPKVP